MKVNKWTVRLAAAGLVSLPLMIQAEEKASPVLTALSPTTISGYVDTSAHWNLGTGNANPPPFLYNAGKSDGFNLNKVKVTIDKPLDEARWSAGYKVDLLFGPDANVFRTSSSGIDVSDFAIQQAYVALNAPVYNGLEFKMGVFNSIIGYESHDSVNDDNYTRSYAVSLEPHTHTGLLATYTVANWMGISAGVADTLGPVINARSTRAESSKTYMGAIELVAPDTMGFLAGSKLYVGGVNGFGTKNEDQSNLYVGAKVNTPVKGLTVGGSFDFVENIVETGQASVSVGGTTVSTTAFSQQFDAARSYALYASYQMEKWGLHLRGEYAEGFPLTGPSSSTTIAGAVPITASLLTPTEVDIFALTTTISYDLWKNVLTRVEFRWDHDAEGKNAFGGQTVGSPTRKNEYLLAANIIYKF